MEEKVKIFVILSPIMLYLWVTMESHQSEEAWMFTAPTLTSTDTAGPARLAMTSFLDHVVAPIIDTPTNALHEPDAPTLLDMRI